MEYANHLSKKIHSRDLVHLWVLGLCLILSLWVQDVYILMGFGVFFSVFALVRIGDRLQYELPLTSLMLFVNFLQLILAASFLYFYPSSSVYDISTSRYPLYFSYVVPACISLSLGVVLSEAKHKVFSYQRKDAKPLPIWATYGKHLVWFGLFIFFFAPFLGNIAGLGFLLVLLSSLRFVGVFTLILSGQQSWLKYTIVVFSVELVNALSTGMFHTFLLWFGSFFLITAYQFQWKKRAIIIVMLCLLVVIPFQSLKNDYRAITWGGSISTLAKLEAFAQLLGSKVLDFSVLIEPEEFSPNLPRFNQGWIVDRVMSRVPTVEPYAVGTTFLDSLYAVFAPRILFPDKPVAGGRKNYEKYTGLRLDSRTSMTIGVVGEMYANFGLVGGVIGFGAFGYLVGFLYSYLRNIALQNPTWWAWGPFVGFWAIKGEAELSGMMNWIVKSLLVMALVVFVTRKAAAQKARKVHVKC